jgi:hypothetical protein
MNEDGILLENETLINYSNSSKNEIFNISNVFKIIYSQGINFHSSLKKTINNFFDESKVFEAKSLMGQNLNFFYQSILLLKIFLMLMICLDNVLLWQNQMIQILIRTL